MKGSSAAKAPEPEPTTWKTAFARTLGVQPWQLADEIAMRAHVRRGEVHAWTYVREQLGRAEPSDETRALMYALIGHGEPVRLTAPRARPLAIAANAPDWQLDLAPLIGVTRVAAKPVPQTDLGVELEKLREQCDKNQLASLTSQEIASFDAQDARIRETNARLRSQDAADSRRWDPPAGGLADIDAAVASLTDHLVAAAQRPPAERRPPVAIDTHEARAQLLIRHNEDAYAQARVRLEAKSKAETQIAWQAHLEARQATFAAMLARVDDLLEQLWTRDRGSSLRWIWLREFRLALDDGASPIFMPRGAKRSDFAVYALSWLKERGVVLDEAKS